MIRVGFIGLNNVIKDLKREKRNLEPLVKVFMERLFQEGFNTADITFREAIYAGTNDVTVLEPYWEDDTLVLSAQGHAVAFIEFGTGVHYDYPDDYPADKKQGVDARGTYGHGLGKLKGGWRYKGDPGNEGWVIPSGKHKGEVLTMGNPPARAMLNAGITIRDRVREIAREVFK